MTAPKDRLAGPAASLSFRPPGTDRDPIVVWLWTLAAAWTMFIGLALWWNTAHIGETVHDLAQATARSGFGKDLLYGEWISMHGGVYVPATGKSPPDPFLAGFPERDITTPSGRRLTLVSPSYMARQVRESDKDLRMHFGRIVSLRPVLPEYAPDGWERKALEAFGRGETEAISVEPIGGEPHLRLMRPMRITAGCLKCHSVQGYREGEIRGGFSGALPMKEYEAIVGPHQREEVIAHGAIWIFGMVLLGVGSRRIRRHQRKQDLAQAATRESEKRLTKAQEIAHVGSWELDLPSGRISWSDEAYRIFGLPHGSATGYEVFLDVVHPDDRDAVDAAYSGSVREGRDTYEIEHRIVRKSTGEIRHVREKCQHFRDASGRIVRSIGMVHDVTEKKRVEEERQRQADELRARNEELTRFNRVATDREIRMIELKREVNELRRKAGEPPRYPLDFSDPAEKG